MNYFLEFYKEGLNPMFSFIIPTYNRVELLQRAVESINKLKLNFSYEIVIVDNNSDVQMSKLFVEYLKNEKWNNECSIRYYYFTESCLIYQNWNNGIKFSRAHYFTILNDDDVLLSGFKDLISVALSKKPTEAVCGTVSYWDGKSIIGFKKKTNFKKNLFKALTFLNYCKKYEFIRGFYGNPMPGSLGVIFNKNIIEKIGFYDCEFGISADYEFNSKCLIKVGIIRYFNDSGLYYLHNNTSATISTTKKFVIESARIREFILVEIGFNKSVIEYLVLLKQSIFLYEHSIMFNISNESYSQIAKEFKLLNINRSNFLFYRIKLEFNIILNKYIK